MARIDDWNMLCEAYKKADEEEKSTWLTILKNIMRLGAEPVQKIHLKQWDGLLLTCRRLSA
jgi:hypothetical protein